MTEPKTVKVDSCLHEVERPPEYGDKCDCKAQGAWRVQLGDKLYAFSPANNFQKDSWLLCAKSPEDKLARIGALRWQCGGCGTLQLP